MSFARRIARNASILVVTHFLTYAISILAFSLLARHLHEDGLGRFNYISSVLNLFFLFTSFGLDTLLVREVARQRERTQELIGAVIGLKLTLATLVAVVYYTFVYFSSESVEIKQALSMAGLALWLLACSASLQAIFVAHERMELRGAVLLVLNLVQVSGLIAVALLDRKLTATVFVYHVLGAGSGMILGLWLIRKYFVAWRPGILLGVWADLLRQSVSFFTAEIAGRVYFVADVVLVRRILLDDSLTGWYSAPKKLLEAVYLITTAATQALYPALAHRFASEEADPAHTFREIFSRILLLAFPSGVFMALCAEGIIDLVFGLENFSRSVLILQLMGPVAALQICEGFIIYFAYVLHLEKQIRRVAIARIPLTLAADALLIWQGQLYGAVAALAMSNLFTVICCLAIVRRKAGPLGLRGMFFKPLLFSLLFAAPLWPVRHEAVWITVPVAGVVYLILLRLFGELGRRQLEELGWIKPSRSGGS